MKTLMSIVLVMFVTVHILGQNFIGMHKNEIIKFVKTQNPEFEYDSDAVNKTYKYLKFVDRIGDQTWLFFLGNDDKCILTKLMTDYGNLNKIAKNLDNKYTATSKTTWSYFENEQEHIVTIKKEEWYVTVITKKK